MKHDGKDAGKGLKQLTEASVEDLEKACSEDPNCVAFSTSGWLKSSIPAEESEWYDLGSANDPYQRLFWPHGDAFFCDLPRATTRGSRKITTSTKVP